MRIRAPVARIVGFLLMHVKYGQMCPYLPRVREGYTPEIGC
jgi:hypothetical protein